MDTLPPRRRPGAHSMLEPGLCFGRLNHPEVHRIWVIQGISLNIMVHSKIIFYLQGWIQSLPKGSLPRPIRTNRDQSGRIGPVLSRFPIATQEQTEYLIRLGLLGHVDDGCQKWEFFKHQGPQYKPQIVGFLLHGHQQQVNPICRNATPWLTYQKVQRAPLALVGRSTSPASRKRT